MTSDNATIKARISAQLADTRAHASAVALHLDRATGALIHLMTAAEQVQATYPDVAREAALTVRDSVIELSRHASAVHELAERSTRLLQQLGEARQDG